MFSSRPILPALGLLAAGCLLAACGASTPPEPPRDDAEYVAIGDSYTAVSGMNPDADGCLRSADDYPALVAKQQGIDSFTNASCGGASSPDLTQPQAVEATGYTNSPQLESLSARTKLVTVGIGGNDYPLGATVVGSCDPAPDVVPQFTCKDVLDAPRNLSDDAITSLGKKVAEDLAAIKAKAPNARIVFVNYPRLVPRTGGCPDRLDLSAEALDLMRYLSDKTSAELADVARTAKVDFVDMYAASEGHDICSAEPWVNRNKDVQGKAFALHPFPAYHRAVAAKIVALLAK